MREYLDLLRDVRSFGAPQVTRNGNTRMLDGAMLRFDLALGFPILTTKAVNFYSIIGELRGFINGAQSAAHFRQLGTSIWDKNANENQDWISSPLRQGTDDLGRIYGAQWRRWRGRNADNTDTDQLHKVIYDIIHHPQSRRLIVTAWNPAELHLMALPPCHLLYQFIVEQQTRKLHLLMYQRSCDMFLGVPFNISSYALLLSLVAHVTNYEVGNLTMFLADVHIYENHFDQVAEQIQRSPRPLPILNIKFKEEKESMSPLAKLESFNTDEVSLSGYDPHPAIPATLNV